MPPFDEAAVVSRRATAVPPWYIEKNKWVPKIARFLGRRSGNGAAEVFHKVKHRHSAVHRDAASRAWRRRRLYARRMPTRKDANGKSKGGERPSFEKTKLINFLYS